MKTADAKIWLTSLKENLSVIGARTEYIEALKCAIQVCSQRGWFVRWTQAGGTSVVVRLDFPDNITNEEAVRRQYKVWCSLKKTMSCGNLFEEYKLFYAPTDENGKPDESQVIYEVDIAQLDDRMKKMKSAINKWCEEHGRMLIAETDLPRFSRVSRRWMWGMKDVETDARFWATQEVSANDVRVVARLL